MKDRFLGYVEDYNDVAFAKKDNKCMYMLKDHFKFLNFSEFILPS